MKQGFTLIELLVVVLIIGILAAVALPQYTKAVEKSRTAEVVTLMGDIMTGERIYQLATGHYTANLSALDIEVPNIYGNDKDKFTTKNYSGDMFVNDDGSVRARAIRTGSSAGDYTLILRLTTAGLIHRECSPVGASVCSAMGDWNETSATN